MNDEELKRVNTLDRYEQDIEDWSQKLEALRRTIDLAELTNADTYFTDARRTITGILGEFEQARHFLEVKRAAVNAIMPDVSMLFGGRQPGIQVKDVPDSE